MVARRQGKPEPPTYNGEDPRHNRMSHQIEQETTQDTKKASHSGATGKATDAGAAGFHSDAAQRELETLVYHAGVFLQAGMTRLVITGADRVRWLNGMVTCSVRDLSAGHTGYAFLLNSQGRIQGDGDIYTQPDRLLLVTDKAQAPRLLAHLDHYIIMDEVELQEERGWTALGIAGPEAADVLGNLTAFSELPEPGAFVTADGALLAQPRPQWYSLWLTEEHVQSWWDQIIARGASPCGSEAVEALRILCGVPQFGVDITERSLAQETGQAQALNFNKGCYLGQEIVERVRSRGAVHRSVRAFMVDGQTPARGTQLFVEGKTEPVGELTSITTLSVSELPGTYALGVLRNEAAGETLRYEGGLARALAQPPIPHR